jgi:uncharacterized protein YhbP (UPF0306 family)
MIMDKIIIDFIKKQTVASICCLDEKAHPYCFSVFFAFNSNEELLFFKSSSSSHHAAFLHNTNVVAGTIQPDRLNTLLIRGVQFTGEVIDKTNPLSRHAVSEYHKRFPLAMAMPGEVWVIRLDSIKMTDNTKGFGKKILWERMAAGSVHAD